MAWVINGIYKQEKDEVVTGVRVEWNNGLEEDDPDFVRESKTWGRGGMSVQELKAMLIGAGTLQSPLGELKAWTDHYNSTEITESPMT